MSDLESDAEVREALEQDFALLQAVYGRVLRRVYELDRRPGSVPGARPGYEAVTFLRHKLHVSNAGAYVCAARALAEDLPQLGTAFSGRVRLGVQRPVERIHRLVSRAGRWVSCCPSRTPWAASAVR